MNTPTHQAGLLGRGLAWVLVLVVFLPIIWVIVLTWMDPRPYFIQEADLENGYYYWSRLACDGLKPALVSHPGTPVIALGRMIMELTSKAPLQAQEFFNAAYMFVGVVTAVAFWMFTVVLRRFVSTTVVFCALVLMLAWPSVPTYFNHFGSDSFTLALGLPCLLLFWRGIGCRPGNGWWWITGSGALMGLCLAAKVTFLPVAVPLFLGAAIHAWRGRGVDGRWWFRLVQAPLMAGVTFLLFTVPVWIQLPDFVLRLFYNSDTRPDLQDPVGCVVRACKGFSRVAWPLLVALALLGVRFVVTAVRMARSGAMGPEEADDVAAVWFLGIGLLGLCYTGLAFQSNYMDPGLGFRNAYASALITPFLLFFLVRRDAWIGRWFQRQGVMIVVTLSILLVGLGLHLRVRHGMIREHEARAAVVQHELAALIPEGERLAVWDGSPADLLGPASFHLWGNSRYGEARFDAECRATFPRYAWFDLRKISRDWWESEHPRPPNPGWLQRTVWVVKDFIATFTPHEHRKREVVSGEDEGLVFSVIAAPVRQVESELEQDAIPKLKKSLEAHFRIVSMEQKMLGGQAWWVIRVARYAAGEPGV